MFDGYKSHRPYCESSPGDTFNSQKLTEEHVKGSMLKMAPIKDGSFGPVAATAAAAVAAAAAAAAATSWRWLKKKSAGFFVLNSFESFWIVLSCLECFGIVLDRFGSILRRFGPFSD